jgi:polysaccharide export outer membrane protein
MKGSYFSQKFCSLAAGIVLVLGLSACSGNELPTASYTNGAEAPVYRIGPLDTLEVFVWRNEDVSGPVTVRPDGRITMPLVEDLYVTGKTPAELGRDIEKELSKYIQNPLVTVMVNGFKGPYSQQIRVVGAALEPRAIQYQADMTLLDVMIEVGGITDLADGNRSTLARHTDGEMREYRVRVDSLIRDGDISANVAMLPGDVLIIPESVF